MTLTMALTFNFQAQILNLLYVSEKMDQLPWNKETNLSNVTIHFGLDHDIDLEFWMRIIWVIISQGNMVRLPQNEKHTYQLNARPQM